MTKVEVMGKGDTNPVLVPVADTGPEPSRPELSSSLVNQKSLSGDLDRQKVADSITRQNDEILRQNRELIELLKKSK